MSISVCWRKHDDLKRNLPFGFHCMYLDKAQTHGAVSDRILPALPTESSSPFIAVER